MTAIIDYGAGNLQSVEKALRHIGCGCTVAADPAGLMSADSAVLPGALGGHTGFCQDGPPLFGGLPGAAGAV